MLTGDSVQVLWEIATQERPSRGKNREVQCPEDCPAAVADLIYACLESQPSARPTAKVSPRHGGLLISAQHDALCTAHCQGEPPSRWTLDQRSA